MIWEPFLLALVLGLIVSAGLYFAYLWPSVEPLDEEPVAPTDTAVSSESDEPKREKESSEKATAAT